MKYLINDNRHFKTSKIVNMDVDKFLWHWNRLVDRYSLATIKNYRDNENDWNAVKNYIEDIKMGVKLDPPYLKKDRDIRFFRIDGTHRAIACKILGIKKIPVEVFIRGD